MSVVPVPGHLSVLIDLGSWNLFTFFVVVAEWSTAEWFILVESKTEVRCLRFY